MAFDEIRAVLFDKDGTLFDFSASWSGWAGHLILDLAQGDAARASAIAAVLRYDLQVGVFEPSSPVIAGTLEEQVVLLAPVLPDMSPVEIRTMLHQSATEAKMVPPVPLGPLLGMLQGAGLTLGVATNDGEAPARAHLTRAGVLGSFAHVLGYDSGYTPKPAPDMLLGFAERMALPPRAVVMVGDSTHDLIAGRAAGMVTVGVLTGLAPVEVLAPHADAVIPDIGYLPEVLGVG
ncbi:MAG: HAD family hydrolase [Rhodobacteraceae bacterium]|nr:MAG: HAD family hydrolase [Paracoccaceae bacterium]